MVLELVGHFRPGCNFSSGWQGASYLEKEQITSLTFHFRLPRNTGFIETVS
jgi:hypothetical protein